MTDLDSEIRTYIVLSDEIWADLDFDELLLDDYSLSFRWGHA